LAQERCSVLCRLGAALPTRCRCRPSWLALEPPVRPAMAAKMLLLWRLFFFLLQGGHSSSEVNSGAYVLNDSYVGDGFFSKWSFWDAKDLDDGFVKYADSETAALTGIAKVTLEDKVVLSAETRQVPRDRGPLSVRIESRAEYDEGLFVLAIDHMPTGCGTWPSFYMAGEAGEYDVIEGANRMSQVVTSLHTDEKEGSCRQVDVREGEDFSGTWAPGPNGTAATNCDREAKDQWKNQGCAQQGPQDSIGAGFNTGGGGTYAGELSPKAGYIRTWFWPAGSEPADIRERRPAPDSWGTPYSHFNLKPEKCTPDHFPKLRFVIDLNFCGGLGSSTFAATCSEYHNVTCEEFVTQHGREMAEAYWSIRGLDMYRWHALSTSTSSTTSMNATVSLAPVPKASPMHIFLWAVAGFLGASSTAAIVVCLLTKRRTGQSGRNLAALTTLPVDQQRNGELSQTGGGASAGDTSAKLTAEKPRAAEKEEEKEEEPAPAALQVGVPQAAPPSSVVPASTEEEEAATALLPSEAEEEETLGPAPEQSAKDAAKEPLVSPTLPPPPSNAQKACCIVL